MAGTENIKGVLGLVFEVVEGITGSLEDGKFDFSDTARFFGLVRKIGPAVSGFKDIAIEFNDLTVKERRDIDRYISREFDIENDIVEAYIEIGLRATLLVTEIVPLIEKQKKQKKAK